MSKFPKKGDPNVQRRLDEQRKARDEARKRMRRDILKKAKQKKSAGVHLH